MSKHTPGEWDVNEFNDLDGDRHIQVVLKSNGCPLAHMYETGSETRANARLMAAAPALLEALKESRETLEKANKANGPITDTIWHGPCETLFDFMDAAITKAEAA